MDGECCFCCGYYDCEDWWCEHWDEPTDVDDWCPSFEEAYDE